MTRTSEIRVGTAGWAVPARYADRVPAGGTHLERYARVLDAVEINTSFARPHRRETYERWAASVPDDFRFAVKLPKAITHEARLLGAQAALDRFAAEIAGLGAKCGVVLVQLPPSLSFDHDVAAMFFHELAMRLPCPVVCEPREANWFSAEADRLMREARIARVAADPAPVAGAAVPGGWPELVYWRLHGSPETYRSAYPVAALATMRSRLAAAQAASIPVWCIFDNTAAFHALGNALAVAGR